MRKSVLVSLLIICLIIGFFVGVGSSNSSLAADKDAKITLLTNQVNTLTTDKATLQSQVTSLQSQASSLQGQLSTKTIEASNLQSQVTSLQSQLAGLPSKPPVPQVNVTVLAVSFSRTGDTSSLLQHWISRANSTIRVDVYEFSQSALSGALIAAKVRGVDVEVEIDNQYVSSAGSQYQMLLAAGVSIRADQRSADMHHKFMVIDGSIVETGSYNWSNAAQNSNDENVIILRSKMVAQDYTAEFNRLWALAK